MTDENHLQPTASLSHPIVSRAASVAMVIVSAGMGAAGSAGAWLLHMLLVEAGERAFVMFVPIVLVGAICGAVAWRQWVCRMTATAMRNRSSAGSAVRWAIVYGVMIAAAVHVPLLAMDSVVRPGFFQIHGTVSAAAFVVGVGVVCGVIGGAVVGLFGWLGVRSHRSTQPASH